MAVLAGVVAAMHVGKLPPALPRIREDLGLSLVAGGFVISLFNVLGMSLSVFVGGLCDWLGRRRLVIVGFSCLAAGGALAALSHTLPPLMISRLVEGVGFIAISVSMPAVVLAAASERDRPMALSLWSVYTPTGMTLVLLSAPVALEVVGWRGIWWVIAALCPFMAYGVLWAMRQVTLPAPATGRLVGTLREAVSSPGLLLLALIFCVYAFQWVTLMVWLPTFLTESLSLDLAQASVATALVVLSNIVGCLAGGWLLRGGRSARRLVLLGGAAMGVAEIGIFLPVLGDGARIALCIAFSLLGGLIPPGLFGCVPLRAPSPRHLGAGNGMLMQGSALGQFAGAPIVAATVSAAGNDWRFALIPMLTACAVSIAAATRMQRD